MAKCITCGCNLSFFQAWNGDPCANCAKANSRRAGHPNRIETKTATVKLAAPTTPENIKSSSQTASEGSTTPATAFTSLAYSYLCDCRRWRHLPSHDDVYRWML
jgi:hypothetical protein